MSLSIKEKINITSSKEYACLLEQIKEKIYASKLTVALSVNFELISLYWGIGNIILRKQKEEGWGAKITESLSKDMRKAFPKMKGFSRTNVHYMAQFAKEYPEFEIVQQLVGQIPWGHNLLIMQRLVSFEDRKWYIKETIERGWSRNALLSAIGSRLHLIPFIKNKRIF